jgi:hypothetical protein
MHSSSGLSSDARLGGAEGSLTRSKVEDFQSLVEHERGIRLDPNQAWRRASQLVSLYRMLMGPIPEDPGVRTSACLPPGPVDKTGVLE